MTYLYSFLFVGAMCLVAQIILDNTKLTPGHITSIFVVIGALLELCNVYDMLSAHIGGGASVLITSFGHLLTQGAYIGMTEQGLLGILTGMFSLVSAGIASVIIFSFLFGLIFKPKH